MNITELLITGYDDQHHLFALSLTAGEARIVKLSTGKANEVMVGEAWERPTDAFTTVRNLMSDIVSASDPGSRLSERCALRGEEHARV
jgi:hypothetical protein